MVAYVVVIREKLSDSEELAAYVAKAREASAKHAMTIRALHGRQRFVEGPQCETVTILEFPTFEEAERWYDDPAYRDALAHRFRAGEYRAVIVDGVSP